MRQKLAVFSILLLCLSTPHPAEAQSLGGTCSTEGALVSGTVLTGSAQVLWCNGAHWLLSEIVTSGAYVGIGMSAAGSAANIDIALTPKGTGNVLIQTGSVGIGTALPGALLDIGLAGTTLGTMRLEGSTSRYVQLQTNGAAGSWTITLPTSAGTNGYLLQTDGTGITSWVAAGSGGAITLGTSTSVTNPQRSGEPGTGFYTAGSGLVDVAALGTSIAEFSAGGENIVTGSLKLAGVNGIWQDAANRNLAVGATAFPTTVSQAGGGNNGQYNLAIGKNALNANTTGNINLAVGQGALSANTTGVGNTALGFSALNGNTTGTFNVAVGLNVLQMNTTGSYNTAVGNSALLANTTGAQNTAVGSSALTLDTSGSGNTALGSIALQLNTTGSSNTAIGLASLLHNTTGSNNTALGYQVGYNTLSTGSNNILIGTSNAVDTPSATTNNFLDIGNVIFATGMTGSLSSPAGSVGIGTTTPGQALDVNGSENLSADLIFNNSNGVQLYTNGTLGLVVEPTASSPQIIVSLHPTGVYGGYGTAGAQLNLLANPSTGSTNYGIIAMNGGPPFTSLNNGPTMYVGPYIAGTLALQTANTPRLVIDSTGNVGIGTTSPQATLDVSGYARLARNSSQPVACSSTNDGAIALTALYTLCVCNGGSSAWVQESNGTTACTW